MNAMRRLKATRRPRSAPALAVLLTIVAAMTGTCLLAGCTSNGSTTTTPAGTGPALGPGGQRPRQHGIREHRVREHCACGPFRGFHRGRGTGRAEGGTDGAH